MTPELRGAILWCWLAASAFTLYGLLALWAARAGRMPFLRLALLIGTLSLPLLVEADELTLTLAVEALALVAVARSVALLRRIKSRRQAADNPSSVGEQHDSPWRFSLRDLLLTTALIAGLCAIGAKITPTMELSWQAVMVTGSGMACITALALAAARQRGKWCWRPIALAVFAPLIGYAITISSGAPFFNISSQFSVEWWHVAFLVAMLQWSWLTMVRAARPVPPTVHGEGLDTTPMNSPFSRRIGGVAACCLTMLLIVPPAAAVYLLLTPTPLPQQEPLSENVWPLLVRQAGQLQGSGTPVSRLDFEALTQQGLEAFVVQNRDQIEEIRPWLSRPGRQSIKYGDFDRFTKEMNERNSVIALASAMYALGLFQMNHGSEGQAADCFLDDLRICRIMSNGGDLLSVHRASAVEDAYGVRGLSLLLPRLDVPACRRVIAELQVLENGREPLDDVLQRFWADEDNNSNWQVRLHYAIGAINGERRETIAATEFVHHRNSAHIQLLICALAIRCHALDHGQIPAILDELVPAYLDSLPVDPFSGERFVYRPAEEQFQLYSVGRNGRDNGGRWSRERPEWDDIIFEVPTEPLLVDESAP